MTEDRAYDAVDHLQTALLELIAAVRAVLDVAEEAVREPSGLRDLMNTTARAAAKAASTVASNVAADAAARDPAGRDGGARPTGVEHIRVS